MATDDICIRHAREADLTQITEIYNHYVINTPITFDLEPYTADQRRPWFAQFSDAGRHQLFVAEGQGTVLAYAGCHGFRPKRAYDVTAEVTIYCDPDARGQGLGTRLFATLFDAISGEDLRSAIAGITLPNDASIALHERFGFTRTGLMRDVGRKFDRYWDVAWYQKRLA